MIVGVFDNAALRTFALLIRLQSAHAALGKNMRRGGPLLLIFLMGHSPTLAQTVAEAVHADATGAYNMCGIIGENALVIRQRLKAAPTIVEERSTSDRFETYFSSTESKQWTVTTRKDAAYPTVTCVHLFNSGGGTDMSRQMRCDASRAACDALFQEFQASDEEVRKQIRNR